MKGRLVELPCAVGDKIYYIDRHTKKIDEDTVKYFTITKDGCRAILERHNIKFWDFYEWGKTVFVKKEDAENALDHPTEKGETERQIQIGKTMIEKMVACYDKTEKGGAEE